ncbi:hypothetical protein KMZ93_23270 [Bradyrhizobium sediminis]|uniref:Formate dehydrogenase n=1 Tax=Bradyrhizobium sediminis TaxID=2840469 RepID=A0A975NYE9_9BRAD|nr:hypothetical protein [Bradyrhizobium sediminis]QWG22839.1 hypothetical protein KMZ93_23270 [Bradyrhizobium sediminis]
MSKPSDSKAPCKGPSQAAAAVDRRRFFLMGGSAVAAAAVVPLSSEEAAADESQAERVKARYKETDHVKNYYRVNRY